MDELERSDSTSSFGGLDIEEHIDLTSISPLSSKNSGVTLTFNNVSFNLDVTVGSSLFPWRNKKITKTILNNVSGHVEPGQLLAIMGATGSGKTSLLNVLAGKSKTGVTGEILVNGRPVTKQMKRKTAFILQKDVFYSDLTARETLDLTALLRLPKEMTKQDKLDKVTSVIDDLNLTKAANTIVGATFPFKRGLSGGEQKRLNIANEILTDPVLLMVDEPTAGLDSSTAWVVLKLLKELALGGRTIVCTIHQPSSRMYQLFDDLMLLSDGHIVYYGPAKDATSYFSSIAPPCPSFYNPADYLLQLCVTEKDSSGNLLKDKLVDHYKTEVAPNVKVPDVVVDENHHFFKKSKDKWPTNFLEQFCLLGWRAMKQKKGLVFNRLLVGQIVAIITVVSLIWARRGDDTDEFVVQDMAGLLFFISVYWSVFPMFKILTVFPSERGVLARERATGTYRLLAFYISKECAELPLDLVLPSLFSIVVYWATGLNPSPEKFFFFWFMVLVDVMVAYSLGLMFASAIINVQKAIVVAATFFLSSMLLGGFYIADGQIPEWLAWAQYLSPIRYVYESLLVNELRDQTFELSGGTVEGNDALDDFDVDPDLLPLNVGIMFVYFFVTTTLGYFSLRFLNQPKK